MYVKLVVYNMLLDTVFYLPNRFRHILLTNGLKIDCVTSENALLGMMKHMFNLEGTHAGSTPFTLSNFSQCYSHFFRSTMIYEGLSLSMRTIMYDHLVVSRRRDSTQGEHSDWPIAFAIGAMT